MGRGMGGKWRRCLCPGWHSGHLIVHHQWEQSFIFGRWCRCRWRHSGHLIVHHQWECRWRLVSIWRGGWWCPRRGWHSGHLIVHNQWEHSFIWAMGGRRCRRLWRHSDHLIVHHPFELSFLLWWQCLRCWRHSLTHQLFHDDECWKLRKINLLWAHCLCLLCHRLLQRNRPQRCPI